MWVEAAPTEPLSQVLDAAENASPLQAVEAVTGALAASLNAEAAFFLARIEARTGRTGAYDAIVQSYPGTQWGEEALQAFSAAEMSGEPGRSLDPVREVIARLSNAGPVSA